MTTPNQTPAQHTAAHYWAALVAWLLCTAAYLGTANGVASRESDLHNAWHHYEYLVYGFLSGHLYVSRPPDPALLALPDPYDPVANKPYRLWDASLYHGHYYLYYGPTPALLLMLPYQVLTGSHLPQRLATGLYAALGLAALALLLVDARRRYFPATRPLTLFWAVILAGHITWLPVLLRRPAFWELPIACAAALFWWSLYFLWRYFEGRRARWAVAMGIALGLGLGARPTYLFVAAAMILLCAFPIDRTTSIGTFIRRMWPAAVPVFIGGLLILWYNYARFGSVLEFGQRYQLWGMEERTVSHFSVRYLPFNSWLYLFSVPEFSPYFPFVRTAWSNVLPDGYIATEEMHGVLFAMPALLFGFIAWRRLARQSLQIWVVLFGATLASVFAGAILFCFAGACSRYIVELLAGWSVVAALGFLAFFSNPGAHRWSRVLGLATVAWSIAYVWLASFEFRAFARTTEPELYNAIAHTLNYPSYWIARHTGQTFGPLDLDVAVRPGAPTGDTVIVAAGRQNEVDQLVVQRKSETEVVLKIQTNDLIMVETAPLQVSGGRLQIRFDAPWLYPPAAHPYWDAIADPQQRRMRQLRFSLETEGVKIERHSIWFFDPMRFDPIIRTSAADSNAGAWVTSWHRAADSAH